VVPVVSTISDVLLPFQISSGAYRGRLIRLGGALDAILDKHDYPVPVARLLAEALALAVALAASLKFDGLFTLQVKGDGPVSMLVADVTSEGFLRGYARYDEDALAATILGTRDPVPALLGAGYLAFTVDQGPDTERYQGIVELVGATLAECIHDYFRRSEQLDTVLKTAVAAGGEGSAGWRAAALMLQRMPGGEDISAEQIEEEWRHAVILFSSATDQELIDPTLPGARLLHRLFHADKLALFERRGLEARCRCSEDRVRTTLRSFPREEIEDLRDAAGDVVVTCEFCKTDYVFGPKKLDGLYL
jgi:molecular chaperone Hsp33